MIELRESARGVLVPVRLQPRASKNEIAGLHGGALKLRLTSPPVEGEANAACQDFLAGVFHLPRGRVSIVAGHKARDKVVCLEGVSAEQARRVLEPLLCDESLDG